MRLNVARRSAGMLALLILVSSLGGCSKMMANLSLNQAQKRVKEAEDNEAAKFAEADYIAAKDAINTAQNQMNSQQYSDARRTAKDAATKAKDLVAKVKALRSSFYKSEAGTWIEHANANDGSKEDKTLYDKILQTNDAGVKAHDKEKWDDAIKSFLAVVNDTKYLLQNLKGKADTGLADVQKKKDELIAKKAPEFNPDAIIKIDDSINQIKDLIEAKVLYRLAAQEAAKAIQEGDQGITKTYENESEKLLAEVEKRLTRATQLGAELYATDTYNGVVQDYEELLKKHLQQEYAIILNETSANSGAKLLTRADDLIVETQRESARTKMEAVSKAIAKLTDGKAKTHLPGRVEMLEQMYVDAKTKFEAKDYTETEKTSLTALEEEQKIVDEFNGKTQQEMEQAEEAIRGARGVFDKMEGIFAEKMPLGDNPSGDDVAFENNKIALREELKGKLESAEFEQKETTLKRDSKDFDGAIQTSRHVVELSKQITRGTFQVVSHNAIQELGNELTRYEREGGREYAADELEKTQKMLTETRELHKSEDYRKALEHGAETKAQLEILAQELSRVAVGKIDQAKNTIQSAKDHRGDRYQESKILQAAQLARAASDLLKTEGIKEAIHAAEQAATIAEKAGNESVQQWAEEEMRRTDVLLARGREAGAADYAPTQLDEAVNLHRSAHNLYDAGDYNEAQVTATKAAAAAENALYALVIQSEDAIASAKRFEGWKYESERLAQAIINAKYAREFMDQGNYDLAKRHARHSLETANEITKDAQRAAFHDRLVALNTKVEEASQKGVAYYQIGDLSKIVGEMNNLATDFSPEGYEQSAQKMELIEAQLAGLIEMTPNVLQELVNKMNDNLSGLEERGARQLTPDLVGQASQKIKYAQLDFKNEKYRPSFDNVKDAMKVLNQIALRLDERDYDLKLSQHFMQFSKTLQKFAPVLNMGSPVLIRMTQGPTGRNQAISLVSATEPTVFRQEINDLAAQVSLENPPTTRREIHEATLAMLDTAKNGAGDFEKLLILDQYTPDDAKKIIERAYMEVYSARSRQQHIQNALEHPQTQTEQAGVKRALRLR